MGERISYKELSDDLDAVLEAQKRDPLERYSLEIEGTMKALPAMRVLSLMEGSTTFEERSQVAKELLQGCRVTVYKDGKKSAETAVTTGMEWWAVDAFNADPMALRFLVTVVFTKFLKKYMA